MRALPLTVLGLLGAMGCFPPPPPSDDSPTPPSPGAATGEPMGTAACGAQTFAITAASTPPNVFLLVDRSGSMSDAFGGATSGSKWDAAQTALNSLLNASPGRAAWGLSLFPPNPSTDVCGKAVIEVGVQTGSEGAILTRINSLTNNVLANPRGKTPTADALKTVRDAANLTATDRSNYVVLVTDGLPECNNPADVGPVVDTLYNRVPSVKTFVVGIGSVTASNPALLNQWAEKGHTARTGAIKYYQADDAGQLVGAFDAILGAAQSCSYKLQMPPSDPSLVVGQLDGLPLASDPVNGFTYEAPSQSVVFHGAACDKIRAGTVAKVDVIYGCPPVQIL